MKPRDISFVVAVLAVLALLYYLSISGRELPKIPSDAVHIAAKVKQDCEGCHAPGKSSPLKPQHPPKDQCFVCHKRSVK